MKKQSIVAVCLFVGLWGVTSAVAADGTVAELSVYVRDFKPNHPDFENFSEESVTHLNDMLSYGSIGYDATWAAYAGYHNACGNMASKAGMAIGQDGFPMGINAVLPAYLQIQSSSGTDTLRYGECSQKVNGRTVRGYQRVAGDTKGYVCPNNETYWANPVYFTPGMVSRYLQFTQAANDNYIDGVVISKNAESCDNVYFEQWFTDVEGINAKDTLLLDIPPVAGSTRFYELDYNYNNGGYFPLDSIDPATGVWVSGSPRAHSQFGPQSLSIFCPPYNYQYASTQVDYLGQNTSALCQQWLGNGGPRNPGAAAVAAANSSTLGMQHLRNYNFTMMGYAKFRYYASNQIPDPEVFEFAGDDDMWIYVDGVLAVDLGGTHLSAPGRVNIANLAANRHGCDEGPMVATNSANCWAEGSWHYLHFFYADRQTDGSNLYIRTSLAEIAPSPFGQPIILHAEVKTDDKGNLVTYLFLNTTLSSPSVDLIKSSGGTGYFPILVTRSLKDTVSLAYKIDTLAYYVTGLTYVNSQGADGFVYKLEGQLCSDVSCSTLKNPALNDSLAFNYSATTDGYVGFNRFTYSNASVSITSAAGKAVVSYEWGPVTNISIGSVTTIIPTDASIDRPPFDNKTLPSGELPDDQTGEILISPLPSDYVNDPEEWLKNNLGPWTSTSGGTGSGSVSGSTASDGNGRFTFLQSSTTDATNASGGVTRCYNDGKAESCTSIAFVTDEPFQINVRVFDNLGHFVSQYTESMSEAALKQIVATNSTGVREQCYNTATSFEGNGVTSGSVIATVKMYPISQNGRKMSTGPYIYQVSLIEYPFEHCVNLGGQTYLPGEYRRTQFSMTRGYRRVEVK